MARTLNDLLDDIIYECGQVHVRPARIKSIAREIKRKWPELSDTTRETLLASQKQMSDELQAMAKRLTAKET